MAFRTYCELSAGLGAFLFFLALSGVWYSIRCLSCCSTISNSSFARRSLLLVRLGCALCLFTLGGAAPIVYSCASLPFALLICASLRTTFFCAPHPLRTVFTRVSPSCVGACSLRLVRILLRMFWEGLFTGVPLSFGCPLQTSTIPYHTR